MPDLVTDTELAVMMNHVIPYCATDASGDGGVPSNGVSPIVPPPNRPEEKWDTQLQWHEKVGQLFNTTPVL
jgi:hypothetical protein